MRSSDTKKMLRNHSYLVGVGVVGGAVFVLAPRAGPRHVAELPAPDEDALDRPRVGRQAGDEPPLPALLPPDFAAGLGCNSIDTWNLRLELRCKLRQRLRTR